MSASISLTDSGVLTVLRTFLLGILAAGIEVVDGQDNRVPEPQAANFVVMTPIMRNRLEMTSNIYTDATNPLGNPSGMNAAVAPTALTVQLDCHGPQGGSNAQIITTLFRDEYAAIVFRESGIEAAPLYADDARQTPFSDGEQQIEFRWSVDVTIQVNAVVTIPQAFASVLGPVNLIEVDTTYH